MLNAFMYAGSWKSGWLHGFLLALPFKEMLFRRSNDTLVLSSQSAIQSLQALALPQEVDRMSPTVYFFKPIPRVACYYLCPETMAVTEFLFYS